MAASLTLAANKIRADLGAYTGGMKPAAHFPASATLHEAMSPIVSEMDQIVAGGLHPEHFLQPLSRALEAPTTNVGRAGGETPRVGSVSQPGPAGSAVGRQISQIFNTVRGRLPQALPAQLTPTPAQGGQIFTPFSQQYNAQVAASGLETVPTVSTVPTGAGLAQTAQTAVSNAVTYVRGVASPTGQA